MLPLLTALLPLCYASSARASERDALDELEAAVAPTKPAGDVSLGLLAGYGLAMLGAGTLTSENPYGTAFGAQVDCLFDTGIVFGLGAEYFLGESVAGAVDAPARYARYVHWHARLGYNIRMRALGGQIDVRPSLWVGAAHASVSAQPVIPTGRADALLLAPGLSFHYLLGDAPWYVGEDIRVSLPIAQHARSAVIILLAFGRHI